MQSQSKSGRITLLGDAAHPMLPFQAAGGNNALLDAQKISSEFAKLENSEKITREDIEKMFSSYEQEMLVRSSSSVLGSRKVASSIHTKNKILRFFAQYSLSMINWKRKVYNHSSYWKWSSRLVAMGTLGLTVAYFIKQYQLKL